MTNDTAKEDLHRYLRTARAALLWKLDGLSEYDVRRPLTPSGTNLLGLVKHVASVEFGYLGDTFGRPSGEPLPWFDDDAEPNADMWATADESREQIIGLYHRAWAHADATIDALTLESTGHVAHWSDDRNPVTLHLILIHLLAETNRHAGHADIVRELIDGSAGLQPHNDNLPPGDLSWWETYRNTLERSAVEAARNTRRRMTGGGATLLLLL
ncbi:DinB family protein [Arthrobacter sp. 260]|uniref:DinB family protein n=1 Tax=Arthrobacter sp. 260 TaxID=2735314 RepID=UPI0014918120|nr:DinB family protein [Arthrobacter sp. 260]NOJ60664.1 DinB family protein [Arthrobacter sp. 260]